MMHENDNNQEKNMNSCGNSVQQSLVAQGQQWPAGWGRTDFSVGRRSSPGTMRAAAWPILQCSTGIMGRHHANALRT